MRPHRFVPAIGLSALLWMVGCATPTGRLFPPLDVPVVWPPPPAPARIRYVGQLAADVDLKAARTGWQNLGDVFGGKRPVRSVVAPVAVWMSPSEQLYVADTGGQVVHRFDLRDRSYQPLFEMNDRRLSMPVGVAGDADGIIYVADADHRAIHRFGPAGRYLSDLPCDPLVRPAGLCVDDERGRIYIADVGAHRVLCVDKQGRLILAIGQRGPEPGRFNFPIAVALDGAGRLLVVDAFNHRIQRFRPDGTLDLVFGRRGTAPGDFALPKAVAVDRDGHIYVVDARFENVQVFDANGELLIGFGEEGRGPGEFWLPGGICIDNRGRIFVADSYNRRVQVFAYLPLQEIPI